MEMYFLSGGYIDRVLSDVIVKVEIDQFIIWEAL